MDGEQGEEWINDNNYNKLVVLKENNVIGLQCKNCTSGQESVSLLVQQIFQKTTKRHAKRK